MILVIIVIVVIIFLVRWKYIHSIYSYNYTLSSESIPLRVGDDGSYQTDTLSLKGAESGFYLEGSDCKAIPFSSCLSLVEEGIGGESMNVIFEVDGTPHNTSYLSNGDKVYIKIVNGRGVDNGDYFNRNFPFGNITTRSGKLDTTSFTLNSTVSNILLNSPFSLDDGTSQVGASSKGWLGVGFSSPVQFIVS